MKETEEKEMKKWYHNLEGNISFGRILAFLLYIAGALIITLGIVTFFLIFFSTPKYDTIYKILLQIEDPPTVASMVELMNVKYMNLPYDLVIKILALGVGLCGSGAGLKFGQAITENKIVQGAK